MQTRWNTREAIAFAETVKDTPSNLVTACRGWTAHDLLAHVVAGGGEIARLVGVHLAGDPVPATINFEQREPAFRALAYNDLVDLVSAGGIFDLLATMAERDGSLAFTGWVMDADMLALHVRSELAMHRWDLAGSDPTSFDLLSQPELTAHAVRALNHFDVIDERAEARTTRFGPNALDVRLRVDGEPDVVIHVSTETTELCLAEPDDWPALTTDAAARLLMLWGRDDPQPYTKAPPTSTTQHCARCRPGCTAPAEEVESANILAQMQSVVDRRFVVDVNGAHVERASIQREGWPGATSPSGKNGT